MVGDAAQRDADVHVAHAGGSYPVFIAPGLIEQLPDLVARHLPGRSTALITDTNVSALYADYLAGTNTAWTARPRTCSDAERSGWPARYVFPAGEPSKTRETWATLSDQLLSAGYGRDTAIIALGGGVAGDVAGFVAATYLRGVPFVQVPTTLLAMVDASIGGKTGLDTPAGKNLIGAFHPPAAVIADPLVLSTLPDRDYNSGMAEVIKHGLVAHAGYLAWLDTNADAILTRDPATLTDLVHRSVRIKASIAAADERESGPRAVLNAGHTVAHALEVASSYRLTHGEAVSLGLLAEAHLAVRLGLADPTLPQTIQAILARFHLPTRLPQALAVSAVKTAMSADKKTRSGTAHFALIASPGTPAATENCWTTAAPEPAIVACLLEIGCR